MRTHWQQLEIITKQTQAETIAEYLTELGALSISFVDAKDEPLFQTELNETPLWQHTKVSALFSADTNCEVILATLHNQFNDITVSAEIIEEQDWVRKTQENFPPQCYGDNLWVLPSWVNPADYHGNLITLEPGLAFGTGTHPTTALCLTWLATHPPKNKLVIDYGCGSGILALAAIALGATQVIAVDHDKQALLSTNNNAALNPRLKDKLTTHLHQQTPEIKAPLILANILSGPLIDLSPTLKHLATPAATLILSGILVHEIERVAAAYSPEFSLVSQKTQEEWALLELRRTG